MTEAEKDEIAALVLAVVQEVKRLASIPPGTEPETTVLWMHPADEKLMRRRSA